MNKNRRILVATLVIVALVAAIFVGCKKDKNETLPNGKTTPQAQTLWNRIVVFRELCNASLRGEKSEKSMSLDEMIETLSLVSNYEHSEHMTYCKNTILDTLRLPMPFVDEMGQVLEQDVVSVYHAFEESLQKKMENIDDCRDVASIFSFVLPKEGAKDNNINIVFTRGETSNDDNPTRDWPFTVGDDWIWGQNLGLCNPIIFNLGSDAAQELTKCFTFDRTPPQEDWVLLITLPQYVTYTVYPKQYDDWVHWDPVTISLCTEHWLFYYLDYDNIDPCITWEELNCYWANINAEVVDSNAPLHFITNLNMSIPYFEGIVQAWRIPESGYYTLLHNFTVTYANYCWLGPQ